MATEHISRIRPGAPDNNGDYTSFVTWDAQEERDLTLGDEWEHVLCEGMSDVVTGVDLAFGWVTTPINNIVFEPETGHEHGGVSREDGGTGYQLKRDGGGTVLITYDTASIDFIGIEITSLAGTCWQNNAKTGMEVSATDCLFTMTGASSSNYFIDTNLSAGVPFDVETCVFYGTVTPAIGRGVRTSGTTKLVNNTLYVDDYGHWLDGGTAQFINNVITTNNNRSFNGTYEAGSTNNAANDTLPTSKGIGSITTVSQADGVDWVAPSTGDFNIVATGNFDGTGATPPPVANDIVGNPFPDPSDIGAFALAGAPPTKIEELYIKDGGVFVKYTPQVQVGGAWQEVDAYVLEGGAWVQVHEK